MFSAVKERLKLLAGVAGTNGSESHVIDCAGVRAGVLDCVTALGQLQDARAVERAGRPNHGPVAVGLRLASEPLGTRTDDSGAAAARYASQWNAQIGVGSPCNQADLGTHLAQAVALVEPHRPALALLRIDLDGLKSVCEVHGLDAGDELLSVVAARLVRAVRDSDVVCRLGSDEFTCLLTALPPGRVQLSRLACKLFDTVSDPITIGRLSLSVRPSIGIAIWPMHGASADALLDSAAAARGRARRYQSGYAFFDGAAAQQFAPPSDPH